jgi:hypothetical protein
MKVISQAKNCCCFCDDRVMRIKTSVGEVVEIDDAVILSAAARLRSRMRKQNRGGRPPHVYACRFCGENIVGGASLLLHERTHFAEGLVEVKPEDLVPWEPPDSAA